MIAEYFAKIDLGALCDGNNGNLGNRGGEVATNGAVAVTDALTSVKAEPVTAGHNIPCVTNVTELVFDPVTPESLTKTPLNSASATELPVLSLLPPEKACYCCKGTDYWLAGTAKYPHWVCRKCHPPAPGAEKF